MVSVLPNLPALSPPPPPPAAASTSAKARPKRARIKNDKKNEHQNTSRFHCDFCGRDLSFAIRARCAVCADYDSCLDCFSVGAALYPHKPEHAYRLIEVVHTPIFQQGWSADEEDKLLEGLELYGVGNWEQVSRLISSKNPLDTEQHFMKVFLQSITAPLPDPTAMIPTSVTNASEGHEDVDPKALRVMHMHQQEDAAGWMEKRQDFVYEWDNDAEDIIGDMELADDDTKTEKDVKAQVLEIYAKKLDERDKRKHFVLQRGLTNFKAYQAREKRRPKEERELREKLRVFMRFVHPSDMEKFINGVIEERSLRTKIESMKEARALGAKTLDDYQRISSSLAKNKVKNGCTQTEASALSNSQITSQRRQRRSNGESSTSEGKGVPYGGSSNMSKMADCRDGKGLGFGEADSEKLVCEKLTGAELLSRTEMCLCTSLKIAPHQYMIVKEVMVRENARMGCLRKKDAKAIIRLDSTKVFKIYDYILSCGWIRSGSNSAIAARSAVVNAGTQHGTRGKI